MADRVSVPTGRYRALVAAAKDTPCFCAAPETRVHGGTCISCWALAEQLKRERELKKPFTDNEELTREYAAFADRRIERLEAEQRLRATQLPDAERLVAAARAEDHA